MNKYKINNLDINDFITQTMKTLIPTRDDFDEAHCINLKPKDIDILRYGIASILNAIVFDGGDVKSCINTALIFIDYCTIGTNVDLDRSIGKKIEIFLESKRIYKNT